MLAPDPETPEMLAPDPETPEMLACNEPRSRIQIQVLPRLDARWRVGCEPPLSNRLLDRRMLRDQARRTEEPSVPFVGRKSRTGSGIMLQSLLLRPRSAPSFADKFIDTRCLLVLCAVTRSYESSDAAFFRRKILPVPARAPQDLPVRLARGYHDQRAQFARVS
jgi:hypothetical protein